ncbi:MAG TPA: hypothetical protein DF863_07305 [Gammaproteobacteria bacterium]|nr:hypothetical protein [Gammaproteobacteria bacterium]
MFAHSLTAKTTLPQTIAGKQGQVVALGNHWSLYLFGALAVFSLADYALLPPGSRRTAVGARNSFSGGSAPEQVGGK